MERFITERNIAHYGELLATDLVPDERVVIEKLVALEQQKLARLKGGASAERLRSH